MGRQKGSGDKQHVHAPGPVSAGADSGGGSPSSSSAPDAQHAQRPLIANPPVDDGGGGGANMDPLQSEGAFVHPGMLFASDIGIRFCYSDLGEEECASGNCHQDYLKSIRKKLVEDNSPLRKGAVDMTNNWIRAPMNPMLAMKRSDNVDPFYMKDVFLWLLDPTKGMWDVECPNCVKHGKGKGNLISDGEPCIQFIFNRNNHCVCEFGASYL